MHHSLAPIGFSWGSILLIVVLCFHSVFEGIAIGVAETKDDAWKALWAISFHKIFAAIALLRMIPNCSPSYHVQPMLLHLPFQVQLRWPLES